MDLDRTTQRELNRLAAEAQRLWEEQREVLSHARDVARSATRQASGIAQREVLPRAANAYRETVLPLLSTIRRTKISPVKKKSSNPLVYVLMAIGAIAVAAISYQAYQTLRADDSLWIEDDGE
jgi:transcription elongation GreA/GreB family factor